MSDSESDLLPSNVFTFQDENTIISAKGPSINGANITNLSFRNNVMTSTMHMTRNFDRQRFMEPSFDQRNMCHRRETSPASMYSGSDMRGRNFHQSYYGGGMSSQRSMYYGRSGSPMSMRSMDSNASVSAADIALAFKNVNFNKHDLRMIKEAYNKFMKRRIRKKIEKRRNMRLFLKGYRRKSGYDSGEQGSDSSISSNDCKSTSSAMYKDNMSCRSTRTDISDFRRTIRDSNMYKDCTENFKHNAFKSMFTMPSAAKNLPRDRFATPNAVNSLPKLPETEFAIPNPVQKPTFTQKDRFNNGYLLPSQRFNKSVASMTISERDPRIQARLNAAKSQIPTNNGPIIQSNNQNNYEMDSDQEEIFSEVTVRENSNQTSVSQYDKIIEQGKRILEVDDIDRCSERKRPKLSSPIKTINKANNLLKELGSKQNKIINEKSIKDSEEISGKEKVNTGSKGNEKNDFEFIKPQFPARKSGPAKPKEKLISKSAQPLTDVIIPLSKPQAVDVPAPTVKATEANPAPTEEQSETIAHSNSDLSMRPSFIKRKLFTQKMDVTERKNMSSDAINVNSPQTNVYSAIQKEKHKARKLVTNQSCLSRDIAQEGNNLLDLIHKIVPPERMNVTNITNKTSISTSVSSKNPINDDDKWDVTSVISTCNNDDCSETYTDEEIFGGDDAKKKKSDIKNVDNVNKLKEKIIKPNNISKSNDNHNKRTVNNQSKPANQCRILVEKLPQNNMMTSKTNVQTSKPIIPPQENDYNKKSVYNCVKSFWDTDFESDMESPAPKRTIIRSESIKENQQKSIVVEEVKIPKNNKMLNISLASVSESIRSKTMPTNNLLRKFNISKTLSIKSLLTPKQVKSKPKLVKEILEDKEIPNKAEHERKNSEPQKKATKQSKLQDKIKNFDMEVHKTASKISSAKHNGDLLNISKAISSQTKSKSGKQAKKSQPKKPEINDSNDLNTTAKSTRSQAKTKGKVNTESKKTNPKKTESKMNTTIKTQSQGSTKSKPSKDITKTDIKSSTKNNSDNLNSSDKTSKSKAKTNKNKTAKPQSSVESKTEMNKSISRRTVRTPKRKACCEELKDNEVSPIPSATNSSETKNKKKKVVDGTNVKTAKNLSQKAASKVNESTAKESVAKVVKNNKVNQLENEAPKVLEVVEMNRTLRSRRIDLSSSINSSTENVTLQIRSLRTRRVDLSNSLKNSSLDETILKGPRTNAVSKKVTTKSEVLNKPRSVKNQTLR